MPLDPVVLRVEDLRSWHREFPDAVPLSKVKVREKATCVGVVHKIRLVPGQQVEVTVEDGYGRLTAIFSGRSTLAGLDLGSGLRVVGTIARDGDGRLLMRNPAWWHVTDPYQ